MVFRDSTQTEQEILDNFLYQYEFAGYGYNTYYAKGGEGLTSASPLPYFILTSDAAIFFSDDLEFYMVEESPSQIAYMHDFFHCLLKSTTPLCSFMRTKEDFSRFTAVIPQSPELMPSYYYDLSANLCMASYLDAEILADSTTPGIMEHRDYFIHGVANFFNFYAITPNTSVFDSDSLMSFVENDTEICDYHNVTFDFFSISPENKLKMLKKLRHANKENISNGFIIIPDKIKMPSFFHVNAFSHNLILGFNFKIIDVNDNKRYIATEISQDPVVSKYIKNLTEYITHSPLV